MAVFHDICLPRRFSASPVIALAVKSCLIPQSQLPASQSGRWPASIQIFAAIEPCTLEDKLADRETMPERVNFLLY